MSDHPDHRDHLYFHTSGQIISRPRATDADFAELVELTRRLAESTDATHRTRLVRDLVSALYDVETCDALSTDTTVSRVQSILEEAEAAWVDAAWDETFAAMTPAALTAPLE